MAQLSPLNYERRHWRGEKSELLVIATRLTISDKKPSNCPANLRWAVFGGDTMSPNKLHGVAGLRGFVRGSIGPTGT